MSAALWGWRWDTLIRKILPETWTKCLIRLEGKWAKVQVYTVSGTVADTLVWLVGDLERLWVKNWYDRVGWGRKMWMKLMDWMKTVKIFMTQGNDHQRPLPAEKASKSKVDEMTHPVAVAIFFPQPSCCSLHGPMCEVAIVAELVTTTGISPPMTEDHHCEHLPCHQQRPHWALDGGPILWEQPVT